MNKVGEFQRPLITASLFNIFGHSPNFGGFFNQRDFEIPSPVHPMTTPVYLDYHQKATFLFVINGSPVRPENSGRPVGIGRNRDAARRVEGSEGEKENACPKFFGRRASVSGKQVRKNGTEWKVGTLGKDEKEKGAAARRTFRRPL